MRIILDIDITNVKALALLNYIRTLDFIAIKENKNILTNEQKQAIDKSIEQLKNGESFTHDQVMNETKQRYHNLFK